MNCADAPVLGMAWSAPPRLLLPARQAAVKFEEAFDQAVPAVPATQLAAGTVLASGKSMKVGAEDPPESTSCLAVPGDGAADACPPAPYMMPPAGKEAALTTQVGQEIAGVVPPLDTTGVVPVTLVTPTPEVPTAYEISTWGRPAVTVPLETSRKDSKSPWVTLTLCVVSVQVVPPELVRQVRAVDTPASRRVTAKVAEAPSWALMVTWRPEIVAEAEAFNWTIDSVPLVRAPPTGAEYWVAFVTKVRGSPDHPLVPPPLPPPPVALIV